METIYPTDIGCYTLGFLPPLSMGDFLICMGSSVSTACGFSKATDKKVISFIGDSTFFHSGISGLVNAVFNNHNFTLVILDNGTTAMTGHQPNPGVDMSNFNLSGYGRVSIEAVVRAIGVEHVTVIKPYKVKKSIEAIREALEYKGVSVIISQEMCTLYAKRPETTQGAGLLRERQVQEPPELHQQIWPARRFTWRTNRSRSIPTPAWAVRSAPRSARKMPSCRSRQNRPVDRLSKKT